MKRLFLLLVYLVAFVPAGFSQANYGGEKGVSSAGVIIGYGVDNKSFMAGLDFRYNILKRVRLAPSVLYLFEKDLASTWYANVDAHYLARISRETTLYPIAGLGLSVWKFGNSGLLNPENFLHEYGGGDWGDNSGGYGYKDTTKIGLNLGVGCETRLTEDILVGGEFKYNITNERLFDQAMITIRAAYYF